MDDTQAFPENPYQPFDGYLSYVASMLGVSPHDIKDVDLDGVKFHYKYYIGTPYQRESEEIKQALACPLAPRMLKDFLDGIRIKANDNPTNKTEFLLHAYRLRSCSYAIRLEAMLGLCLLHWEVGLGQPDENVAKLCTDHVICASCTSHLDPELQEQGVCVPLYEHHWKIPVTHGPLRHSFEKARVDALHNRYQMFFSMAKAVAQCIGVDNTKALLLEQQRVQGNQAIVEDALTRALQIMADIIPRGTVAKSCEMLRKVQFHKFVVEAIIELDDAIQVAKNMA